MVNFNWKTVLAVVLLAVDTTKCFISIVPVLDKMVCKHNNRLLNLKCALEQPESRTNQSISLHVEILRELKDVKIMLTYYAVPENGTPIKRILQRTHDLCTYVKRPISDRLFKLIFDHMLIGNRFPRGCPLKEQDQYYIHHLRPAAIRIPAFLPESGFIFESIYYGGVSSMPLLEVRYYGALVRVMDDEQ